jgi:hypothetical protein
MRQPARPGRVSRRRGKPGAAMLGQQCNTCSALPGRRMRRLTKVIQTHVCGLETDAPGLEGASHKDETGAVALGK